MMEAEEPSDAVYVDAEEMFVISEVTIDSEPTVEEEKHDQLPTPVIRHKKRKNSNERERWRHRNVNNAYENLGRILPVFPVNKKLKKKEILVRSIKYIKVLEKILQSLDVSGRMRNGKKSTSIDEDTRPIYAMDSDSEQSISNSPSSPDDPTQYGGSSYDESSSDELDQLLLDLQSIS